MACAVHTKLDVGVCYTTLEMKANLVRAIRQDSGILRATGNVIHYGRTTATAESRLVDLSGKLYARYVVSRNGMVVGRAYIDTHQVRTKKESLLVSLDASGRVQRIDVTVFLEPPEYIAGPSWMRQFYDKPLDGDLAIQRSIRPIAGATLTAYAISEAIRRVMAMDQVLTADMEATP